jgi:hypothetical protein
MSKLRRLLVSTCMALMLPAAALAAPKVTFNVKYAPPKGVVLVTGKGFTFSNLCLTTGTCWIYFCAPCSARS